MNWDWLLVLVPLAGIVASIPEAWDTWTRPTEDEEP